MPPSETISVFHVTAAMVASVQSACGVSNSHAPSDENTAADRNCAVAPGNNGMPRQNRPK